MEEKPRINYYLLIQITVLGNTQALHSTLRWSFCLCMILFNGQWCHI